GDDTPRARDNQAGPDPEAAENRKALAARKPPMLPVAPRVAPPRRQLPEPANQQHPGRDEQPQVLRRREPKRLDVDAQHVARLKPRAPSQPPAPSPYPLRIF